MKRLDKELAKLSERERRSLKKILEKIEANKLTGLDVRRLRGERGLFRVRKGDLRIFFFRRGGVVRLLGLERRATTTYRKRR